MPAWRARCDWMRTRTSWSRTAASTSRRSRSCSAAGAVRSRSSRARRPAFSSSSRVMTSPLTTAAIPSTTTAAAGGGGQRRAAGAIATARPASRGMRRIVRMGAPVYAIRSPEGKRRAGAGAASLRDERAVVRDARLARAAASQARNASSRLPASSARPHVRAQLRVAAGAAGPPVDDEEQVEAVGALHDVAELPAREGEDGLVELGRHLAAGEVAEVAAAVGVRAERDLPRDVGERGAAEDPPARLERRRPRCAPGSARRAPPPGARAGRGAGRSSRRSPARRRSPAAAIAAWSFSIVRSRSAARRQLSRSVPASARVASSSFAGIPSRVGGQRPLELLGRRGGCPAARPRRASARGRSAARARRGGRAAAPARAPAAAGRTSR